MDTRYNRKTNKCVITVRCCITTDPEFETIINEGVDHTTVKLDFTIKLEPNRFATRHYIYYRFHAKGHSSPIGRTKTLPTGHVDKLRIAFTSCSNYPYGHFNVYRMIVERNDLDAILHLGDYVYEYANREYQSLMLKSDSPDDYWQHYAQYIEQMKIKQQYIASIHSLLSGMNMNLPMFHGGIVRKIII